jgi:hypothetical protein
VDFWTHSEAEQFGCRQLRVLAKRILRNIAIRRTCRRGQPKQSLNRRRCFPRGGCVLSDIIDSKMVAALARGVSEGRRVLARTGPANLAIPGLVPCLAGERRPQRNPIPFGATHIPLLRLVLRRRYV